MNDGFNQYYDESVEPGKRERAYAWATAIGLQDVDGLKPSRHLFETARRHIEGEISESEARRIVDEYYETKDGHDLPADTQEADMVAARIVSVLNSPTFNFSPAYFIGLHQRIFEGIFPHAGQVRTARRMPPQSPNCIDAKNLIMGMENLIFARGNLILARCPRRQGRMSRNCRMSLVLRRSSSVAMR